MLNANSANNMRACYAPTRYPERVTMRARTRVFVHCLSEPFVTITVCDDTDAGKRTLRQTTSEVKTTMGKSIRDAMTSNPRKVDTTTPVAEAAKLMKSEDVGSLPVTEGDRLVGMVTDRDIVTRVVAEGKDVQAATVGEIASKDLVTVDPQQDLDEALKLMAQHQVRRLPVVEEDGRLVGILAQADVAREGKDSKTGQLVEQISD
jgi:CBS domain-containing protein